MTAQKNDTPSALHILRGRWKDGTFHEILSDWKWILSYSRRHWKALVLYTILGILSTTLSLASSIAGKYTIDIITGFQTHWLVTVILIMAGTGIGSLVFESLISRVCAKVNVRIHNDIQADIFDKIMDADWLSVSRFSNGDILNRFNSDIGIVSSNAITWLPTILIAAYRFLATLLVLLHYDAIMALIAFASAPMLLILSRTLIRKQRQHGQQVRQASSRMMSFESEAFYHFDTIKSFGATGLYSRKLRQNQSQYADTTLRYDLFSIKTNAFMSAMNMLVQFAAFGYCLLLLWSGSIT